MGRATAQRCGPRNCARNATKIQQVNLLTPKTICKSRKSKKAQELSPQQQQQQQQESDQRSSFNPSVIMKAPRRSVDPSPPTAEDTSPRASKQIKVKLPSRLWVVWVIICAFRNFTHPYREYYSLICNKYLYFNYSNACILPLPTLGPNPTK